MGVGCISSFCSLGIQRLRRIARRHKSSLYDQCVGHRSANGAEYETRGKRSASPLVTNQFMDQGLKGRNKHTHITAPSGLRCIFFTFTRGDVLSFALAPGCYIPRFGATVIAPLALSYLRRPMPVLLTPRKSVNSNPGKFSL